MRLGKLLPVMFFLFVLLYSLTTNTITYAADDDNGEREHGVVTYSEGNDNIRLSKEAVFVQASSNHLFGLIKGDEHSFIIVAEIKATEIREDSNVTSALDDEEYSHKSYSVIKEVKKVDIVVGTEDDDFFVRVTYEFLRSKIEITYVHSTLTSRAYLDIRLDSRRSYSEDKYDVGWLCLIDGSYEEIFAREKESGNYAKFEIEL